MKISIITLLRGNRDYIPIILHNYNNFSYNKDDLELVVIDDGKESSLSMFKDVQNCTYLHLTESDISEFMEKIIEGSKAPDKLPLQFQNKIKQLPDGFRRDYGVGMSSHDFIFHMNYDCLYHPKTIERKVRLLKKVGSECIYCDSMLCYDIYNKELYKTISPQKIYESTLFHTRDFWKRKGFKWDDIENEGRYFHYNNGVDRKMDNYYDTIQLLSIHCINKYNPVKVEVENIDISIPDIVSELTNHTDHPVKQLIKNLYPNDVSIVGIHSEFLQNVTDDNWTIHNIVTKFKEKKLVKDIQGLGNEFEIVIFNSKQPIWSLFENIQFKIIILETSKNYEQMNSIILQCKKYKYIQIQGIYILQEWIEQ